MDFKLTDSGDLFLSPDRFLEEVDSDELTKQTVKCCAHSVQKDWYIDNIGADLEQLVGQPINEKLQETGCSLLKTSILSKGIVTDEQLWIESQQVGMSIHFSVYLKTEEEQAQLVTVILSDELAVQGEKGGVVC